MAGTTYLGVDFIVRHMRNVFYESDTHEMESVNAELRHWIVGLCNEVGVF